MDSTGLINYVAFKSEQLLHLHEVGSVRETSIRRIERLLINRSSAILAAPVGLGKSFIASKIADRLAQEGSNVRRLRCARRRPHQLDILRSEDPAETAIVIDDAHLLDAEDLAALTEMMCAPGATVLITIDPDDAISGPVDGDRKQLLTSLWTDLRIERVDLCGVGYEEAVSIIEQITGRAGIDIVSRTKIIMQAAGNPLMIRELALERRDNPPDSVGLEKIGTWGPVTVSSRIQALTRPRLDALSDEEEYALITLSRIGAMPYARASRLVGGPAVRTLLRLGLAARVSRSSDGVSANDLYASAALAGQLRENPFDAANKVELLLIEDYRAGLPLSSAECALIATYFASNPDIDPIDSMSRQSAADLFARAARHSGELGQYSAAELFAHRSLSFAPNAIAAEQASRCLAAKGKIADALEMLENLDVPHRDRREDGDLLAWWMLLLAHRKPDAARLDALDDRVRSWNTVTDKLDDWLAIIDARGRLLGSEYRDGAAPLESMVQNPGTSKEMKLRALTELLEVYAHLGQMSKFSSVLRLGWSIVAGHLTDTRGRATHDRRGAATAFVAQAGMLRVATGLDRGGLSREMESYAFRAVESADQLGLALVNLVAGQLALEQNDAARAETECRRVLERLPSIAHPRWQMWAKVIRANALASLGRHTDVVLLVHETARDREESMDSPWLRHYTEHVDIRLLADTGNLTAARAAARALADAESDRSYYGTVRNLYGAFALGDNPASIVGMLDTLIPGDESEMTHILEDHIRAEASGDARRLNEIGIQMTTRGLLWEASLAFRSAARIHRSEGREDAAAASEERLASLLHGTQPQRARSQPRPIDREAAERLARLTRRELEVAQLTGAGLSNSEIAKRLFLSVRTVESHVLQARVKLGASRRGDLGRLVADATAQQPAIHAM